MNTLLSIASPRKSSFNNPAKIVLAADVGGTKTNMALFRMEGDNLRKLREHSFKSASHASMLDIIQAFDSMGEDNFDAVSLAIAGPVYKGKAHGTNLPWDVEADQLRQKLKIDEVFLINDLEANAYGLGAIDEKDVVRLYQGDKSAVGNVAIISPGTGLGEAGLYWDGKNLHPFASEGGHCDFSPQNDLDVEMLNFLRHSYDHVSWERLISGPGIINIFEFFQKVKGMQAPDEILQLLEDGAAGPVISKGALDDSCAICQSTIDLFLRYLAEESGNLILKYKATGGLFIGGGIVPNLLNELDIESFLTYLQNSGRMEHLLKQVPVTVIMNEKTALLGAAFYGF